MTAPLLQNIAKLDAVIEPLVRAARIPGAAIAVVSGDRTVYARGFGYRDAARRRAMTSDTVYPIASTTKTINATLLGMLVDQGNLEWDAPVQRYLPRFQLRDATLTPRVTIRDLVTMRTGLPRHDWVWWGSSVSRQELIDRIPHLELSADFRQRFQYSNLSVTAAGHVAEVVTGRSWEALVRERIFRPLRMRRTFCARPAGGNVTLSYHENYRRRLLLTRRRTAPATAPSGGAIHSTVEDMARWVAFNLAGGRVGRQRLISTRALAEIHAPQVVIGDRSSTAMASDGAYALGWLVDCYNGHKRLSHGGYLQDVNTSVMLFPRAGIGMVCFINFGCPALADLINQQVFDVALGSKHAQTLEERLAQYEARIIVTRKRNAAVVRIPNTRPSCPLRAHVGRYRHAAYGEIRIQRRGRRLILRRDALRLTLKHWHYDVWVAEHDDMWVIHQPHALDQTCPLQFYFSRCGEVAGLSIPFEPEVAPIQFERTG